MSLPCPRNAKIPAISSTGKVLSMPHTRSAVTPGVGTTPSPPCPSGVIVTTTSDSGASTVAAATVAVPVTTTDVSSAMAVCHGPGHVVSSPGTPITGAIVAAAASPITSTLGGAVPLHSPVHMPGIFPTSANILPQIYAYHGGE